MPPPHSVEFITFREPRNNVRADGAERRKRPVTMRRALVAAVRFALANAPAPSRDPVAALPRWHRIPPLGSGGTGSFSNLPRAERVGWSARRHLATSTCAWRDGGARDTRGDGGARRGKPGGGGGGGRGGSGGFGGGGGGGRDSDAPSRTRDRPSKKPSSSFGGKKKSGAPMALPDRFAALATREAELEGADPPIPGDTPGRPDGAGAKSKSKSKAKAKQRRKEAGGPIEILSGSTIAEVARALKTSAGAVEKALADLGESAASAEEVLSDDLVELLALELGLDIVVKDDPGQRRGGDPAAIDPPRRAVVAVMGHVDHGKTTLLDTLRDSSVAAGEAGGITQHIGAFVVKLSAASGELTFLDTPGHAAFSAMRQRGAKCTDVAVLVCAADDGVMPQTREAAAHIQAANCRYVVAITKCDAPGANPTRVRDELIAAGIPLEQSGGDVQCVDVSALSGQGMEDLEMALFLEAEAMNLRAPRDCDGVGVVLEARKDPSRGPVVTGLLRRGRLEVGACVVAGAQYGRVRRLVGYGGGDVDAIGPSEPFELAGLRGVPLAGDPIQRVGSEDRARRVARAREARATQARLDALAADAGLDAGTPRAFELEHTHAPVGARGKAAVAKMRRKSRLRGGVVDDSLSGDDDDDDLLDALDDDDDDASQNRDLCCIVKADVQGTAEAVRDAVLTLGSPAVGVKVVYVGVGPVTESDVSLAAAIGGPILAFNVREPPAGVALNAKRLGVPLVERKVIYHLLDAVGEMLGDRAPERLVESVAGEAEVRAVFDLSNRRGNKANVVAGCLVNVGALDGSERFRVMRDGSPAHEGLLECESIRRHKLEVTAVGKGTDCGVSLRWGEVEVRVGDVLQCVKMVKKKAAVERVATGGARVLDE